MRPEEAELELLLRDVDGAIEREAPNSLGESESRDPAIEQIARQAKQMADALRRSMDQAQRIPDPAERRAMVEAARQAGSRFVNVSARRARQRGLETIPRPDLDLLVGALSGVEHAIKHQPSRLRRLKKAVHPLMRGIK